MNKSRLEAYTDAIIAIIITLMVLIFNHLITPFTFIN